MSVSTPTPTITRDATWWAEAARAMTTVRLFEERCEALASEAKVRGSMHLCAGQEAVSVGVTRAMEPQDTLSFTYRSHGWALARGIAPAAVFGELFGRVDGCSGGWGGSKHLGDWSKNIFPSNAIVGGNVPMSTGAALAAKLTSSNAVSVAAFGDGALNQGVMHEAFVMASIWDLPIVYVCENNGYGEMTDAADMRPVGSEVERAAGWGLNAVQVDGMDAGAVNDAAATALARAREGGGPTFIEAITYRYSGHMTGDTQTYRSKEEVAEWRARDPLLGAREAFLAAGGDATTFDAIRTDVAAELTEAEATAWASPEPSVDAIVDGADAWMELA